MHRIRLVRSAAALATLFMLQACSTGAAGGLGDILGSVLGGPSTQSGQNQASGTITGVDTRNQQIGLQTSNGQNVALRYDNNTRVVYQQQQYPVTALERGDRVTVRVQQLQGGGYYTDYVQVDQSVSTNTGTTQQQAQAFQGTVREVNVGSGWFTVNTSNYGTLTVSLPYAVSSADNDRFRRLRAGESVRFYAVPLNNTRVELQRFY